MKINMTHNGFDLNPEHVHEKKYLLELSEKEMQLIAQSVAANLSDYPNDIDDEAILKNMAYKMCHELQK